MKKLNSPKGFTLIELLVVIAIIGVLAAVILAALGGSKDKGSDAAVKANLANAIKQGELFFNINTAAPNTYANICTNGVVGGAQGVGAFVLAAAKASGLASYGIDAIGSTSTATCNDGTGVAWAAQVPLSTSGQMWCVDSTGKSTQVAGNSLATTTDTTCN